MDRVEGHSIGFGRRQVAGWLLGPALLLLTFVLPAPEGLKELGWRGAGGGGALGGGRGYEGVWGAPRADPHSDNVASADGPLPASRHRRDQGSRRALCTSDHL